MQKGEAHQNGIEIVLSRVKCAKLFDKSPWEDLGKKYLKWGKMKHSKNFDKFKKEILPDGRILYTFDNGSVAYSYEFTEI